MDLRDPAFGAVLYRPEVRKSSSLDFIGNVPVGFLDQSDAGHPAEFPIMTSEASPQTDKA